MNRSTVTLESSEGGDVVYLYLPKHPGKDAVGIVKKQISLSSVVVGYKGPEIYIDFDGGGEMVGIEFLFD